MEKLTIKQINEMLNKEEVVDREHTELSASWAKIWLHCTKATELVKKFPPYEEVEDYTLDGTRAHFLAEQILLGKLSTEQLPNDYLEVADYVERIKEIQKDGNLLVEVKVNMTELLHSHTPIYGRSDVVVLAKDGGIDICDLKWGKGVVVSAVKNEQLMLYAIGTLQFLEDMGLTDVSSASLDTRISLHIIQPRLDSSYSYYNTTLGAIKEFTTFVISQISKIGKHELELCKGDHCQFCKGKVFCPLFHKQAESVIPEIKKDLSEIDENKLVELYKHKADVSAFYRALDKYILANIKLSENGEFGGYKTITKEGAREIVDENALIKQFTDAGCDKAELQSISVVGFSVLDKLAKKYGIAKEDIAGVSKKQTEIIVSSEDKRDDIFKEDK
jgi:hypothetical protein